ncbi:MAG: ferredoxin--NADP(+) reductase [Deltaproteobacteria bacterium]|nr:MAG: ferredoxin--NADP(+) reductase [Deltaproteobacteria bacterium]
MSRPYCACSTPGAPLQFLVVMVPEGTLSPRLVSLEPGSMLALWPRAAGDFTLGSLTGTRDLWLIATGTGLGPFLSMLHTDEAWRRFRRIVVVHAVREASDLVGRDELAALEPEVCWLPVVSRQPHLRGLGATDDDHARPVLHGRVTDLLRTGELEAAAARRLAPDGSRVMLCGNPGMVADMTAELAARGLRTVGPDGRGQVRGLAFWEPADSGPAALRAGVAPGDR